MYISHHLLTLGHQFSTRLPEPLNCGAATFVDLISPIRGIGEKCFEDQLVSCLNMNISLNIFFLNKILLMPMVQQFKVKD